MLRPNNQRIDIAVLEQRLQDECELHDLRKHQQDGKFADQPSSSFSGIGSESLLSRLARRLALAFTR